MKIGKFEVGEYVVKDVGGKKHLVFDCKNCVYGSSLADDPACRFHILTIQQEAEADLLVLADVYERVYDEQQTLLMKDISQLAKRFETESVWSYAHLGTNDPDCEPQFGGRHDAIVRIAHDLIGSDPVLSYLTLLQEIKKEADRMAGLGEKAKACSQVYLDTLLYLKKRFEDTLLVAKTKEYLTKLRTIPDTKEIYKSLLEAQIKPAFIGSRLLFGETEELELLDEYQVGRASVQIFSHPNKTEKLYFLNPPEYTLPPDKYFVLSKTKEVVASYKPGSTSLSGIAKSRKYFERVYESTIVDIAQANKIFLAPEEARELAEIVARYTVGYGMLELILSDKRLTDIFVDSPIGMKPLYVVHSDFGQCQTNILYTEEEASSLVSKMRAMSGRPFDEAHPVLDFDLPDLETRVAVIGRPLAPDGTAFAFRLHKVTPWTLPQFIDNKFINPLGAGLLSFFIDQQATMLVTGSRGSGKTSLLQAMMLEILQNARIITQEDSVTGDSRILVERNGKKESTTVGELIDGLIQKYGCINVNGAELLDANPENVRVFSLDKNGKTKLSRVSQFSRHAVSKDIFKVTTASGKKLKVTVDHSLFGLNSEGRIVPVRTGDLKIGNSIATISGLPITSQEMEALFNSSASSFSTSGTTVFVGKEKQFLNPKLVWDEVAKIEKLESGVHTVYDFSVPECENFVCENILAHNTLELPVEYMKNVGFNIQRLKTRSPISVSKSETEVSPAESLRTALRLGDSALVIGEVRSKEARVLYEAMRVGAAGNIVLGTIHGDSAYSVWDRVVNDLQVPTTSFKATDAVVVARPIRFAGSLKRARRVVEITEVKKHWTQDPDQEGGLLDLMMYTAKDDKLVFQEDALKDSELFQKISRTSGLNMNEMWTAIKSNASAKAFLVDLKNKYGLPLLLEAENYAKCNNKFMLLREQQLEMHKSVDYDELLGKWKFWVQNSMVKRLLDQKSRQKK